ncbi:MAG TPA: YciI family protein [Mycobacteriales bacterium]|nr:YciI family protein [Mycobacteriales bacterium]
MADATFAIEYGYVPQMEERRAPHRADHLAFLKGAAEAGWLVLVGALTDPVDGAWLVVRAGDEAAALERVQDDPYRQAGLVRSTSVRPISLVVP